MNNRVVIRRTVLTEDGLVEIEFQKDLTTGDLIFDEKLLPILTKIVRGDAQDLPGSDQMIGMNLD